MKDMFGKRDVHNTRRYFPKAKIKLKHLKNLNDMNMNFSERQIEREGKGKKRINVQDKGCATAEKLSFVIVQSIA